MADFDRATTGGSPVGGDNLFVICNSVGAFLLNGASFEVNRRAGPPIMVVVGNVKQIAVLLIVLGLEGEG